MDTEPTLGATNLVSLFHTNSVAVRAALYTNWQVGGPVDAAGDSLAVVRMEPSYG